MRAAVMRGGDIEIEDWPDPVPGAGQVLIAPHATGICGSDLHLRQVLADLAQLQPPAIPIVPGHEVAGEVVAVGPGTPTDLAPGDLVAGLPFTDHAGAPEGIGLSPTFSGGLADLTLFDAIRTFRLPDRVDARLGALCEPVAVAVHAFARATERGPIAVIGAGPIGAAIIAVAVIAGRGPIVAVDPSGSRREIAGKMGADAVHEPGAALVDLLAEVGYRPSPMSPVLDGEPTSATVFECVGRPEVIQSILEGAPPHSRVVLAGACSQPVQMNPLPLTMAEVTVETSFAYRPDEFRRAIGHVADRPHLFAQLITSDRPLDATPAAFDDLASDPRELKILIRPAMAGLGTVG